VYQNKYVWVMRFRGGKIELMREYWDIPKWYHAIGPHWQEILDGAFGGELAMSGSKPAASAG
jgi:hypothetical protein